MPKPAYHLVKERDVQRIGCQRDGCRKPAGACVHEESLFQGHVSLWFRYLCYEHFLRAICRG